MPTSGRYQSRFFSFLSEQSLRLRDKTSQTWRQMKIATAWGAQIVLYPIYLAFQTTRLVSRQLRQTVSRVLPQLQAAGQTLQQSDRSLERQPLLASDTPIQNTLQAIEAIIQSLPASQLSNPLLSGTTGTGAIEPHSPNHTLSYSPSPPSPTHSLASLLTTHSLVLVTIENQILDILTADQQLHLQRRMVWEMASYWYQQRSLQGSTHPANFLPLPSDRPNALLPIRAFYRLMTWMQTSPIARATNLFQETQLAILYADHASTVALPASEPSLQAQLPRSAALPWLSLETAFSGLLDRSSDHSSGSVPSLRDRLRHWLQTDRAEMIHLPSSSTPPTTSPSSSQPWLTWETLFGNRVSSAKSSSDEWELFNPTSNSQLSKQPAATIKRPDRRSASISPLPETEATLPTILDADTLESETSSSLVTSKTPNPEEAALSTTWIEAEVKLVTYVKHPLEQVLEWLDRGMVWIEEKVANVVRWLRDRFDQN